ncbi:MAG: 3-deoxy-manno-octulosonate cytidylyltransferase [Desulfatiglandales bacterium]
MKTYAFIPARYGSSRFPGKPLALIAGVPMIRHVYERAALCPEIDKVFVATDDERIRQCVLEFGGEVMMTRGDHPSGTDRITEAARMINAEHDDLIVNIQGDQPLFNPAVISALVSPFKEDPTLPMSTLMCRIADEKDLSNPNHVKVVLDREGYALYFSRAPIPFYRNPDPSDRHYKHLGLYAYRMDFLSTFVDLPAGRLETAEKLEQLRALENGYRIKVLETPMNSIEVDTPGDIGKVEDLLGRQ